MAVLLEDFHVGEGFVALLDEPEMLVQPHDDVDLRRELAGEFIEVVQGFLQGRTADNNGVHHDLLAGQPDLLVHVVLDEIVGDGDKARGAGIDHAMRILGEDRLQHLIEAARVQDGAFHERDAGHIQRRKPGEGGRRRIRIEAEDRLAQMAVVERQKERDERLPNPTLAVEDEVNLPDCCISITESLCTPYSSV